LKIRSLPEKTKANAAPTSCGGKTVSKKKIKAPLTFGIFWIEI
jgi:hypothetical protein